MRNVFTWVCVVLTCLLLCTPGQAEEYRLLRFGASWCGACQTQKRIFSDHGIADLLRENRVRDHLLDIDEEPGTASAKAWNIKAIPTTILVLVTGKDEARPIKRWGDGKGPMNGAQFRDFVNPYTPLPEQK
jgi:hypothetical protein